MIIKVVRRKGKEIMMRRRMRRDRREKKSR